ncbi:hypothetical protein HO173_008129 [Letharia columbiana]|uniref:Uncharacterized protein n=1 Tax=Letharia columbiana TaxID=112416 RepID=A0A8H6FRX8_9LECA|nr:uncharacterized protein HO173_008129 [Letharia columbiana]KAF6233572.1 hypothetical protein HO173_008129 [Letharia columbiana]
MQVSPCSVDSQGSAFPLDSKAAGLSADSEVSVERSFLQIRTQQIHQNFGTRILAAPRRQRAGCDLRREERPP